MIIFFEKLIFKEKKSNNVNELTEKECANFICLCIIGTYVKIVQNEVVCIPTMRKQNLFLHNLI